MASGRPLAPFAAVCVIFAMLVLAGLSDGHRHDGHHSMTPAPAPAPAPGPASSSHGGHGGTSPSTPPSAAGGFSPHLFMSTLFASLAFISPFCY
ncbi:hypothetical protein Acr_02g0013230 [Actinidia rufa]|uniref:Uncharacterized protein n=1 Tax=Actinidia rufa TaxID=165716 RepID=A0A7J0E9C8_9ERIC|nr:hypothetical protein Acr_02g0013230 [Actinidia rufa]